MKNRFSCNDKPCGYPFNYEYEGCGDGQIFFKVNCAGNWRVVKHNGAHIYFDGKEVVDYKLIDESVEDLAPIACDIYREDHPNYSEDERYYDFVGIGYNDFGDYEEKIMDAVDALNSVLDAVEDPGISDEEYSQLVRKAGLSNDGYWESYFKAATPPILSDTVYIRNKDGAHINAEIALAWVCEQVDEDRLPDYDSLLERKLVFD